MDTTNDGKENIIIIDGSKITSTGTISFYTDIELKGDSTITTSKCISTYNNSQIIIDLTTRSKGENTVLSYNCLTVPELDVSLRGSYTDGCIPRYDIKQTSLILVLDTQSCQQEVDDTGLIIGLIGGIVAFLIVIGIIIAAVFSNGNKHILSNENQTKKHKKRKSAGMEEIKVKMQQVDTEINEINDKVTELNTILDQ